MNTWYHREYIYIYILFPPLSAPFLPPFDFLSTTTTTLKRRCETQAFRNSLTPIKLLVHAIVNLRRGRAAAPLSAKFSAVFFEVFRGGFRFHDGFLVRTYLKRLKKMRNWILGNNECQDNLYNEFISKDRKGGWGEVSSDEWMIVVNDIFSGANEISHTIESRQKNYSRLMACRAEAGDISFFAKNGFQRAILPVWFISTADRRFVNPWRGMQERSWILPL